MFSSGWKCEKKNGAENDLGYCPIVLQGRQSYRDKGCKAWIVLQDCIARDLAGDNLYRNTLWCIVTWEQGTWAGLYCNTAIALATRRAGWTRRLGTWGAQARCAGHAGHRRALGARGARPGRAAGLWAMHLVHSACF